MVSSGTKDGLTDVPPLLVAERLNYERIAEELGDAIAKSSGSEREHLALARKKAEHLLVAGYRLASLEIGYALYPWSPCQVRDRESACQGLAETDIRMSG